MSVTLPVTNIPAMAIITVRPGDEHGAPRGRRRDVERLAPAPAGRSLLALPAHVEQRVVDADGEPDQDDRLQRGGILGRTWLAMAVRPIVPATAVIASSTGTAAATSAPNVRRG